MLAKFYISASLRVLNVTALSMWSPQANFHLEGGGCNTVLYLGIQLPLYFTI